MSEYFAVLDGDDRRGPFQTDEEAIKLLKRTADERGYDEEEAHDFFLHRSAVEQVDTVEGKTDRIKLGWLAREKCIFSY